MPLVSSHVFGNHKGGCGKTTLLFQVANLYAKHHPDETVVVLDFSTLGDLSKIMLGGNVNARGQRAMGEQLGLGKSSNELIRLAKEFGHSGQQPQGASGITGLFNRLRLGGASSAFDFTPPLMRPSEVNAGIPSNVLLGLGGSEPQTPLSDDEVRQVSGVLQHALGATEQKHKLFIDTDGDLKFSHFTKVAMTMCEHCVIPLKPNFNDFQRLETFLEELHPINGAKVLMIVWNEIDVQSYKACSVTDTESGKSVLLSPTLYPSKAVQDVVLEHDKMMMNVSLEYPTLFTHPAVNRDPGAFAESSTVCMQVYGITGLASAEHGIPVCNMTKVCVPENCSLAVPEIMDC